MSITIPEPDTLNDRDIKNIVELGISWGYLISDARGNRDNMLSFLNDLDDETWARLFIKWIRDA